jgi:hypothetical protein
MPKKAATKQNSQASTVVEPRPLLPEQILALTRITSDKLIKSARSRVQAGKTYEVDFGVRVSGQVIVGHDAEFMANQTPKALDLVQCLLAQFGPRKRQQIVDEIIVAGIGKTISQDDVPIDGLAELAERMIDGLTLTSKGSRRGNVTGVCDVTVVEWT